MDRCHDAFNDVPIRQTLEDNLQRIVNVAQLELKAERAALFRPSAGCNSVECAASVNLTRTEMQSPAMRDRIAWIADCLSNGKGDRDRQAICLSLNVGGRQPWLLYLDTRFGPGFLTQLKKSELGELARLFAGGSADRTAPRRHAATGNPLAKRQIQRRDAPKKHGRSPHHRRRAETVRLAGAAGGA